GTDRDDELIGVDSFEMLVEPSLEPPLTSQGPRITRLEMLIISHDDEGIRPLGKFHVVVVGIRGRYGNEQRKRMGVQALRELADQSEVVRVGKRRKLLNVEDEALEAAAHHILVEPLDKTGAGAR